MSCRWVSCGRGSLRASSARNTDIGRPGGDTDQMRLEALRQFGRDPRAPGEFAVDVDMHHQRRVAHAVIPARHPDAI